MAALEAPSASFLSVFLPVARASLIPTAAKPQSFLQQIQQRAGSALNASLAPSIFIPIPAVLGDLWNGLLNAVPKKKTSHMKKRHRQMAGKALKDVTALNRCSSCGRLKQAHTLCPYCVTSVKQWLFQKFKTDLQADRDAHEGLTAGPRLEKEQSRLQRKFEREMEAYEVQMERYAMEKEEYQRKMEEYNANMEAYKQGKHPEGQELPPDWGHKIRAHLSNMPREALVKYAARDEIEAVHWEDAEIDGLVGKVEEKLPLALREELEAAGFSREELDFARQQNLKVRDYIKNVMPKEDLVKHFTKFAKSADEVNALEQDSRQHLVRTLRARPFAEQIEAPGVRDWLEKPTQPIEPMEPVEPTKPKLKEAVLWTNERYERDGRRRLEVSYLGRDSVPRTSRMPKSKSKSTKRAAGASEKGELERIKEIRDMNGVSTAPDQPRV